MIALDAATKSLQVVLVGAKSANDAQCYCVFFDVIKQTKTTFEDYPRGTKSQDTNGTTAVTACAAPAAANIVRMIEHFSLYNHDNASITATVQIYDTTGTVTTRLKKVTLSAGTGLVYESSAGWIVL